jgi:hypothetical protein
VAFVSRRPLLGLVLSGIVVTAALGLYAVAVPHFGDLQRNVLGTSASVTAANLLVLACLPAWERRRLIPIPLIGAVATAVAFAFIVAGMWSETGHAWFWRTTGSFLILGIWAVLSSLLALAGPAPRYRWVLHTAVMLSLLLGALGLAGIWSRQSSGAYTRIVAAFAVLVAAFVVAVPVLHRAGRDAGSAGKTTIGFCPICGCPASGAEQEPITCPSCGGSFRVRLLGSR